MDVNGNGYDGPGDGLTPAPGEGEAPVGIVEDGLVPAPGELDGPTPLPGESEGPAGIPGEGAAIAVAGGVEEDEDPLDPRDVRTADEDEVR